MTTRILLVEDEENLLKIIKLNLELEGYTVTTCNNGKDALKEFRSARFNLVILDVMLPEIDGYTICQTIRLENTLIPVLFLTAKNTSSDKIAGLKMGADDYLTKPFNLEEFLLRVQNLIRRGTQAGTPTASTNAIFKFGNNEVNFSTYEIITATGEKQLLSKREIHLLKLLIDRKNEVVSREDILKTVWGYDIYPSTRSIDNYILAFRKYFEANQRNPVYFHSVRGVGYKFTD